MKVKQRQRKFIKIKWLFMQNLNAIRMPHYSGLCSARTWTEGDGDPQPRPRMMGSTTTHAVMMMSISKMHVVLRNSFSRLTIIIASFCCSTINHGEVFVRFSILFPIHDSLLRSFSFRNIVVVVVVVASVAMQNQSQQFLRFPQRFSVNCAFQLKWNRNCDIFRLENSKQK